MYKKLFTYLHFCRVRAAASGTSATPASQTKDPADVVQSKLHLVDLAGSERVEKTGSSGTVQKEANHINRSLSFLEQVVLALTQSKRDHIPYRQSKLTYILKDSLGGNSNTYMIACVWPHMQHGWETLSTLRFAARMACIENTPIRNSLVAKAEPGSARLLQQIDALKKELTMRDMLCGREAWMPVLSRTQRERAMAQACDLAVHHVQPLSSLGGDAGLGDDLPSMHSLSQVKVVVGTLRAMLWEACGRDEKRVLECVQKTLPPDVWQTTSAYAAVSGTTSSSSGVDDLVGDEDMSPKSSSRSNSPKKAIMVSSKGRGGRTYSEATVDRSGDDGAAGASLIAGGGPCPPGMLSHGDASSQPAQTPVPVMSFDEFRGSLGAEQHEAYEEVKAALKNNKARQKEIIAVINQIKAKIDKIGVDAESVRYRLGGATAGGLLEERGDGSEEEEEGAIGTATVDSEELRILQQDEAAAKKEYRIAHSELQICKSQVTELQSLKQRAMATLVQAYDEYCLR